MKGKLIVLFCFLLLITGCEGDQEKNTRQTEPPKQSNMNVPFHGCRTCHPDTRHDTDHDLPCTQCHKGNEQGQDKNSAHAGLVPQPGHPDFMEESCGSCHPENVRNCRESLHFTLRNKVNLIRNHFNSPGKLAGITEIPQTAQPTTTSELVDDMLRRRCLRCHLYSPGDTYPYTQRGTGCAACHMGFSDGKLLSHEIIGVPGDFQCLGCHYANFVGADYYGRYEHDLGSEYHTPFTTREDFFRPYGVEYHELIPDIHQQRGLSCVDCHAGHQPFGQTDGRKITCRTCHQIDPDNQGLSNLPDNLEWNKANPALTARLTGKKHPVPQMAHPAHEKYGDDVSCQVCHAQWSFNDTTTHLLRSDSDDYDAWAMLQIQSSSTVENYLDHNLNSDEEELPPSMPDTITGQDKTGVWYKSFTERRWERILVKKDSDGKIKVFRPILDLRLSYVDSDGDVIFDNIQGSGLVLLPYTPHTTGKAGMFYLDRFAHLLQSNIITPTEQ